jgi:hypothetical protein
VPEWRYIAQNVLTGEFLHWQLPLKRDELTWDLSGPGALRGTITPVHEELRIAGEPILQEWQTAIYAEANGSIRWGGIVHNADFDGPVWAVEAAGFSSYPHGQPYTGPLYSKINWDPTVAFVDIWAHLQSQPDGNLGVVVSRPTNCPVRIGTPAKPASTGVEAVEAQPYELAWWDTTDCGSELDDLARETPFDYVEEHAWTGATSVSHTVRLGYPRLGTMRNDLLFVQGQNITKVIPVKRDGDKFANVVHGLGKGEGVQTIRAEVAVRDGRLRRVAVYSDKAVDTVNRMTSLTRREHTARQLRPEIASITVVDHPNAEFGAWQPGDDIRVLADLQWLGWTEIWCRVLSWSLEGESKATLNLARSDSFTYGGQPAV